MNFEQTLLQATSNSDQPIDNALMVNIALVAVTAVLVGITAYYAKQTKKTVDSMDKATEAQFMPYLKASLAQIGPVALDLQLTNVGKGPAREIEVEYFVQEIADSARKWTQTLMMPDDHQRFFIPSKDGQAVPSDDYYKVNQTTVIIKWKCKDIFEKPHSNQETIDVSAYVKQFDTVSAHYEERPLDEIASDMGNISRYTQGVEGHLRDIHSEISSIAHDKQREFRINIMMDRIQNNESLDHQTKRKLKELVEDMLLEQTNPIHYHHLEKMKSILKNMREMHEETYLMVIDVMRIHKKFYPDAVGEQSKNEN